jgi:hypothetical protein
MKKTIPFLIAAAISTLFIACEALPEGPDSIWNPLDPANPNYAAPEPDDVTGPQNGETISSNSTTFNWSGPAGMNYRHRVDDRAWSVYTTITGASVYNLDDGDHVFYLQARNEAGSEGPINEYRFRVDAIQTPALYLYPQYAEITAGGSFTLDLYLEIADSAAALSSIITYNSSQLTCTAASIPSVNFFSAAGGQLIEFIDYQSTPGEVVLDVAHVSGNPRQSNGTGVVLQLTFQHTGGSASSIEVAGSSQLRDADNRDVALSQFVGSQVQLIGSGKN